MDEFVRFDKHRVLSVGTRVVTRVPLTAAGRVLPAGSVGAIVRAPVDHLHAYGIRLADGTEVTVRRGQFAVLREVQNLEHPDSREGDAFLLREHAIYRCVIGSRAYGLDDEASDTDRRGVYLPPAEMQWSLFGVPTQIELDAEQECYWELQRFLVLGLKANPNVLECLFTPMVEFASPIGQEMLDLRDALVSRLIYQTYNGYVISQFKKLAQDLRNRGEVRWKHAMHLIRLLHGGIAALQSGQIVVDVGAHREKLLAIRRGEVSWDEVEAMRRGLHEEFEAAFQTTRLPERPDYERVDVFLIRARRSMVS